MKNASPQKLLSKGLYYGDLLGRNVDAGHVTILKARKKFYEKQLRVLTPKLA